MTPTVPAIAFCHRCQRDTPTLLLTLSSGHIGNCCSTCRACRARRPYVSINTELEYLPTPAIAGTGHTHEQK